MSRIGRESHITCFSVIISTFKALSQAPDLLEKLLIIELIVMAYGRIGASIKVKYESI